MTTRVPEGDAMRVVPKSDWDLHAELNVRPYEGDFPPGSVELEHLRRDDGVLAPVDVGDATYALDPDRVLDAIEYFDDADSRLWLPNEEDAVYVIEGSSGPGDSEGDDPADAYVLIQPLVGRAARRTADEPPATGVGRRGTGGTWLRDGAVVAVLAAAAWWLLTARASGTVCLDAAVTDGCLVPADTVALVAAAIGVAWSLVGLLRLR